MEELPHGRESRYIRNRDCHCSPGWAASKPRIPEMEVPTIVAKALGLGWEHPWAPLLCSQSIPFFPQDFAHIGPCLLTEDLFPIGCNLHGAGTGTFLLTAVFPAHSTTPGLEYKLSGYGVFFPLSHQPRSRLLMF